MFGSFFWARNCIGVGWVLRRAIVKVMAYFRENWLGRIQVQQVRQFSGDYSTVLLNRCSRCGLNRVYVIVLHV